MTIDETIKHCIEAAAKNKTLASEIGEQLIGTPFEKYTIECQERAAKYNQFAEWLTELKEARRLLKAAVEDVSVTIAEVYNGGLICECCKWKSQIGECCCPDDGGCDVAYRWRYADEAIKLIGENTDETNT